MARRQYGLMELSAVQELTNIGLGHAATALSQMVSRSLLISVPTANEMEIEEIPNLVGGAEVPAVAVAMAVTGPLAGTLAFVMSKPDASKLAHSILQNSTGSDDHFDELERSIFQEVGNIIDSSFLNAISEMTNTSTVAEVPVLVEDMAGCVVNSILAYALEGGDQALIFETKILDEGTSIVGFFMYIPLEKTLDRVLGLLGIPEAA